MTKAMILAAGYGTRMLPLTLNTPKPLLKVGNETLVDRQLRLLSQAGVKDVVINVSYLGQQIMAHCGDGTKYGLSIAYSKETEPLETAGGIKNALPLLGDAPFILVNGDIFTDFPYQTLLHRSAELAHLVMVANPNEKPVGDYRLSENELECIQDDTQLGVTYSGIALFSPECFVESFYVEKRLRGLFDKLISAKQLTAEYYSGVWMDIGTPSRLAQVNQMLGTVK